MAPNCEDVVVLCREAFPFEWSVMRENGDDRFIRRLASILHYGWPAGEIVGDHNFGLNGKRGNPADISVDCVAYKNPTVTFGVETLDVIVDRDGPGARPGWSNVTRDDDDDRVLAVWLRPAFIDYPSPPIEEPGGDNDDELSLESIAVAIAENTETLDNLMHAIDGLANELEQLRRNGLELRHKWL
jgi:hypothetical protein